MKLRKLPVQILLLLLSFVAVQKSIGQTFSTTASATIPNWTYGYINNPISVSGLPTTLDGTSIGVMEVSLSLNVDQYDNLEIFLVAPDGTMVQLMEGNINGGSNNFNGTLSFRSDWALPWIRVWNNSTTIPPYFRPDVFFYTLNNGQDPNGDWSIVARSSNNCPFAWCPTPNNNLTGWSITFGTSFIAPAEDNEGCSDAEALENFTLTGGVAEEGNIYHGSHIGEVNLFSGFANGNNKNYSVTTEWFTFVPRCENDVIRIRTTGAPVFCFVTGNCGGPFTQIKCNNHSPGATYDYLFGTSGFPSLTPGQRYYLISEGENGITDAYDIYWIPGDCGTQPVGLISFTGNYNQETTSIDLSWQTSWERDNRGYYVEYRINKESDFTTAGFVKSSSFSEGSKYNFSLPASEEGFYEIRLIQEDIDGKQTDYGPVVISVESTIKDPVVIKYNKRIPEAWIYLPKDGEFRYSLYTIAGSELSSDIINGKRGWNVLSLPSDLSSGVYLLRILTEEFYWSKKLIKE